MKTLLIYFSLLFLLMVSHLPGQAQDRDQPSKERLQNIQNAKIAFITEKINLTPEQSQRFWPLYNQFETERNSLRGKFRAMRFENIDAMSDAELRTVLNNRINWRQNEVDLDKEYMDKFLKVISVRQLALLYRSEREFTKILLKKLDAGHSARGNH